MNLPEQLSKRAFWDVDKKQMDAEQHAAFIIERVFEYGSLSDIKAVVSYYTKKKVIAVLTEEAFLQKDTLHFAASLFKVPKETFACYSKTQSQKNVGSSLKS